MSRTRRRSPPKAWLVALAVALPIPLPLIAPIMIVEPAGLRGANTYHYRTDLAKFLKADRGDEYRSRGVMLAMSGGSCATNGPPSLSDNGVDLYVVYYPDATLASFHDLLDLLVGGNPDFIVVQDTVLVLTKPLRTFRRAPILYERARSHWTGQLYGLARTLGVQQVDLIENDNTWRCPSVPKQQSTWGAIVDSEMGRIIPYSEQRHIEAVEFLNNFSAAGIPVIIASPPMNSYTVEYGLKMHKAAGELLYTHHTRSAVSFHRQSTLMPAAQFSDPWHLSPDASQPYREWLNTEIIQVLKERSDR